jgi:hypothetical protein
MSRRAAWDIDMTTTGRGTETVQPSNRPITRLARRLGLAASLAFVALVAVWVPTATAEFGFQSWETSLTRTLADGETVPADEAGAHSDFTTDFTLQSTPAGDGMVPDPDGDLRTLVAELPPGLLGNPNATPKCSQFDFQDLTSGTLNIEEGCDASTQVGVVQVTLGTGFASVWPVELPVYNMEPRHPDETARLAFYVPLGVPIEIGLRVRTESDYGIEATVDGAVHSYPLLATRLTLWANPGHAIHDPKRYPQRTGDGRFICGAACIGLFPPKPNPGLPPRAFLSSPTRCGTPLTTRVSASSYQDPGTFASASHTLFSDTGLTGCDAVPFQPSFAVAPRSKAVDSPSGLDVQLGFPSATDPNGREQSHLRTARVTLPPGVSINPSGAHGLQACTDEQLRIGRAQPASCPPGSRIGSAEVESPPLPRDQTLRGAVYQRPQLPGETFRIAIVAEGHGVNAKIPGVVRPDPSTGQIVGLFEETPQVPFTRMRLRFDGGDRAPLATPPTCGTHVATGVFTPWSGQADAVRTSAFDTSWDGAGTPCPAVLPFEPVVSAGSQSATSGDRATFVVRAQRRDRDQELRSMAVSTPPGMSASLKGVEVCKSAQAAAGTCPESSRVGTATSGAGAGTHPFYLDGKAFLTEGYKGGAYGLSIVVPAIAGPFNLGNVIVRAAVHVDRTTAELEVVSDPIPRILEGVPLRLRDIRVAMDRPRFTVNPTSCEPQEIVTTVHSNQGTARTRSTPMRMVDCASLGFGPRFSMRLTGARQRETGGHPGVRARVRQASGQAGIERVQVRLPKALALDPDNAQALCEFGDGTKPDLESHCPKGSIVGRARAISPLLNRPLRGDVYFVKNVRIDRRTGARIRTLPMIVLALRGEIALNLRGVASVKRGRLVSTFANVPDAPVSRFDLNLGGGKDGILVVTGSTRGPLNLCSGRQIAETDIDGHNGRRYDRDVTVGTPCASEKKKDKKRRGT